MIAKMNGMSWIGCLAVLFICLGIPDNTYCQTPTRISLVDCPNGNECATKTNATCNATTQKCKCDAGFEEDSNGGSTCVAKQTKITRVSLVSCPTGNECGTHATCNVTTHKCKCAAGFDEDSKDGSTCVTKSSGTQNSPTKPKVSTVKCSTTGTECNAIPFAVCDRPTNLKCKCKDGYKEDSNGGSTCIKVLGTQCSGSSDCTGATNSACTNSKCTCSTGYNEKDNVCKKLLNTVTCSANGKECDKLDHAECDDKGKCTCSAGFEMNVDLCTAKNSGTILTMKLGIIVLPVLVAIHAAFKYIEECQQLTLCFGFFRKDLFVVFTILF